MGTKPGGLTFRPHAFDLAVRPKNEKASWVIILLFDALGFDDAIFISRTDLYQQISFLTDQPFAV